MNWYYCCKDGKTVIGPLPGDAIDALRRCGTISDETPVVAEGTTDWKTFGETFKVVPSLVPDCDQAAPARRVGGIPATLARIAGNIDLGAILKWIGSHKKAAGIVIVSLLLVLAIGSKIRSKIERERAGREFRERAIAEGRGWNSSSEDYFASETARMKRQLQESGDMEGDQFRIPCDRCEGFGQVGYNCDECTGGGVILRGSGTELACPGCAGRGRIGRTCSKCHGEGKVLSNKPY